jgi:cobalt-precorrin-5B (C1)-methyltransferase
MPRSGLREGFTTGSAAAAASKAALFFLGGRRDVKAVNIPLPIGGRLKIEIEQVVAQGAGARATVIKDGGDDPDVTNRARIGSTVHYDRGLKRPQITIEGGRGVGRVTRRGLPVPVGEAAINPVPRSQIEAAVREALPDTGLEGTVSVVIDVERGAEIARKTLNPRLGILGGISILGTRGTVKPFSNKAYRETIISCLDVAKGEGRDAIALTTGGKSETFLRKELPTLEDLTAIQVADFFAFSLRAAVKRRFRDISYACFFGKLVKMAQGHAYTHAGYSRIDFSLLSAWCGALGIGPSAEQAIQQANTAREAREIIRESKVGPTVFKDIVTRAVTTARRFAGPKPHLTFYLFDFDGELLCRQQDAGRMPADGHDDPITG